MLNHAGLGCGSVAEQLPNISKALGFILSTIQPIIYYRGDGETGSESRVTEFEASLGY